MFGTSAPDYLIPHFESMLLIEGFVLCAAVVYLLYRLLDHRKYYLQKLPKTPIFWLSLGVFAAGLSVAFCAGLGWVHVMLALALGLGLPLMGLHPDFAVSLLVAVLLVRPWELSAGLSEGGVEIVLILPKLLAVVAISSWLYQRVIKRDFSFVWDWNLGLGLALLVWSILGSMVAGVDGVGWTQLFEIFLKSVLIFVMIVSFLEGKRSYETLRNAIVLAVLGVACVAMYTLILKSQQMGRGDERFEMIGVLSNANDIAAILVWIIPLAWGWAKKGSWLHYLGAALVAVGCVGVTIYSQSRGAILSLAVIGLAYAMLRLSKRILWMLIPAGIGLALFVAGLGMNRSADDLSASRDSRLHYWVTAYEMAMRNPLLGVGHGNYPEKFETYSGEGSLEWGKRTAHSSWLLVLAEEGWVGFVLLITLAIRVALMAWRVRKIYPELWLSVAGYFTAMTFLSHSYLLYPWILFGLVTVAARACEGETS